MGRLKAGRLSPQAGHRHLTCGLLLRKRYLVGPRPHVLPGAAAVGTVEPAGSTVVHSAEERGSRGRKPDGPSQAACVVPTRGASVRAACRLAQRRQLSPGSSGTRIKWRGQLPESPPASVQLRTRATPETMLSRPSFRLWLRPLPASRKPWKGGGGKDSGP